MSLVRQPTYCESHLNFRITQIILYLPCIRVKHDVTSDAHSSSGNILLVEWMCSVAHNSILSDEQTWHLRALTANNNTNEKSLRLSRLCQKK